MTAGLVWHELYAWHDPGNFAGLLRPTGLVQPGEHIEHAEAKRRIKNLLDASGFIDSFRAIRPRPATDEELLRFHTRRYLSALKAMSADNGGTAGGNSYFSHGGFEIAALAAGGAIEAVDAVMRGTVSCAYALVRPPGHHAEPDRSMGFCLIGNVAVALHHARAVHGAERVAVVDWDVHHGNGTQAGFWSDPETLTISLHQAGMFPRETGTLAEAGDGAAAGSAINIPLPAGCGDEAYLAAFDEIVLPALGAFRPDLVMVACGLDAGAHDPLGRMQVGPDGFGGMTARMKAAATDLCDGRLVLCHEGGYSPFSAPFLALPVLEELAGAASGIHNPVAEIVNSLPGRELLPHQRAAIDDAHTAAARFSRHRTRKIAV